MLNILFFNFNAVVGNNYTFAFIVGVIGRHMLSQFACDESADQLISFRSRHYYKLDVRIDEEISLINHNCCILIVCYVCVDMNPTDYQVGNESLLIGGEVCLWTEFADDDSIMPRIWFVDNMPLFDGLVDMFDALIVNMLVKFILIITSARFFTVSCIVFEEFFYGINFPRLSGMTT
jgi:hypothetical protein